MEEDTYDNSQGDYYALKLKKLKNSRIVNNALEMSDSSKNYFTPNKSAAAVFYQGPPPAENNNLIDYNIYSYHRGGHATSATDCYRYVSTEPNGRVIDVGYRGEYNTLNN